MAREQIIVPISKLRTQPVALLEQLQDVTIVVTHHSQPIGVLVHPRKWDQLLETLEDERDLNAIYEQEKEEAQGINDLIPLDEEELK